MSVKGRYNYSSPLGNLAIAIGEAGCEKIAFATPVEEDGSHPEIAQAIRRWLDDYFDGRKPSPAEAPLAIMGTEFQKKVWEKLLAIPYGETTTYSNISLELTGKKDSSRAVGQAIGVNPLAIIVPCHRVLAKTGLGGYAWGIEIKKKLLAHEGGA